METDTTREHELRRAKRKATGFLVAVIAGFLVVSVSFEDTGGTSYALAALEAGMVGGFADWFAVTAVFKHPLGIRTRHTAVIVRQKDKFGRTLGDFMVANFLTPTAVTDYIRSARVVAGAGDWLSDPAHAQTLTDRVVDIGVDLAGMVHQEQLERFIGTELRRAAEKIDVAPLAGKSLRLAVQHGLDRTWVDAALPAARQFLADCRTPFKKQFKGPFKPIIRWIADSQYSRVMDLLEAIAADPDHEIRGHLRDAFLDLARRLESDPELGGRVEAFKLDFLGNPDLARALAGMARDVLTSVAEGAAEPGSDLRRDAARLLSDYGRRLRDDDAHRRGVERNVESAATYLIDRFGEDVAGLVERTVAGWDGADTARRLELMLGPDLQMIRINGTVVGAIIGVAIHAVGQGIG